ncbi:hypothetical protein [Streptosporangium sp. V21-05]|uniref:hypothetical protein n=1 Tax=Streptosporangium sp. V21-05 TaxID=3446115 RepID=UPI003F52D677
MPEETAALAEFEKFLITIGKTVPVELDIHLICGNYGTHKTRRRLSSIHNRPPRAAGDPFGCLTTKGVTA